ncbi:MAG: sugar ABC transporter permease [Spirochaetia bacterium]|jgi:arabinogalactan oligomer/maltooligosaccharide transport system permease protein
MKSLTPEIVGSSLGQVGLTLLLLIAGVVLIEFVVYLLSSRVLKARNALVHMLLAPAIIGLALLVIYPIAWEVVLAFSNMSLRHFRDPTFGLGQAAANFSLIFTAPVLKQVYFFPVFLRTVLWTAIQVTFHVTLGLGLALLLNRRLLLKGLYKVLLVIPWAIPQVISCLTWRGEYHYEYGFVNIILRDIGIPAIQWKSSALWNFVAMNITNIWLGVPFMMVICLGGLQSISKEYYEAAKMDGATGWRRLRSISLPLMAPILTPAVILGVIWTFNNFNVPYFINENNLETSDILVTALFRAAFEYNRYGFSAAFAIVIFLVLFVFSAFYIRFTGALSNVRG